MTETHKYVPSLEGVPIQTISGGDLFTCERQLNAQEDRSDCDNLEHRWWGLVPTIEDFHTIGNFYEVNFIGVDVYGSIESW